MFELPLSTTLLVFGFPAFWVAYTVVFYLTTRDWERSKKDRDGGG